MIFDYTTLANILPQECFACDGLLTVQPNGSRPWIENVGTTRVTTALFYRDRRNEMARRNYVKHKVYYRRKRNLWRFDTKSFVYRLRDLRYERGFSSCTEDLLTQE